MPPKYITQDFAGRTVTPEEQADTDARRILDEYGYGHSGQTIGYDEAVKILREVILKSMK